ncbi:MAG: phage tail tape measure protein [Clostridia bacterium]
MEQVFRIEIPVEAVDKTDTAALKQLESTLQKIFASMKQNKGTVKDVFDAFEQGASEAKHALNDVANASEKTQTTFNKAASAATSAGNQQQQAAQTAVASTQRLENTAKRSAVSLKGTWKTASQAGQSVGKALDDAGGKADKFTERLKKSLGQMAQMQRERIQLLVEAVDHASPALKTLWAYAKQIGGKGIQVAVRMKDMITAPFKKLYRMVANPITVALSVAGIGVSATDLVNTYKGFSSGMSTVRAITGATQADFVKLNQTAKDLGATTAFSATQAAEGMKYLGMAGWDVNEIIAAMPGLLDLAASGQTDLGTAADIVSDVMTAMGMAAGEAGRAADVFAKTATASNTSVEGIGASMKYVAPIANAFGASLEEVSTMIGLMANAGIKGEMAGTALRSSMLRMSDPVPEMAAAMKKLNLTFADSSGKMKGIGTIVKELGEKFSALTESQRLEYAQTLFGTEAASAWLGVISQGAGAYDTFYASLMNANGAAKEMAAIQLDNLSGDMEELGGAAETLKLSLMEKLDPYLRSGIQWLTSKIPTLQQMVLDMTDRITEKASGFMDTIDQMLSSGSWNFADGFAAKFNVAWDTLIAKPFAAWWNGSGREGVLSVARDIGGEIMAMLGLALGKAPSVIGSLIGDSMKLFSGTSPTSALSALTLGSIGGKIAGVAGGIKKGASEIRSAFKTINTATASAGAQAGSAIGIWGALKGVLAAIPGWGWATVAAIGGVVLGVKAYNDNLERHRQELLHMGDAVEEATENWHRSVERANDLDGLNKERKRLKTIIEVSRHGLTDDEIAALQKRLGEIKGVTVNLTATLVQTTGFDIATIEDYAKRLSQISDDKVALEATLTATCGDPTKAAIILNLMKRYAQAGLSEDEKAKITADLIATCANAEQARSLLSLFKDYAALENASTTITAEISTELPDGADLASVIEQLKTLGALANERDEIQLKLDASELSPEELSEYENQYAEVIQQIIALSGGLVSAHDAESGAIDAKIGKLQAQLELQKEIARLQQAGVLLDLENRMPEILKEGQLSKDKEQVYQGYIGKSESLATPIMGIQNDYLGLEKERKAMYQSGDRDSYVNYMQKDGGYYTQALDLYSRLQKITRPEEPDKNLSSEFYKVQELFKDDLSLTSDGKAGLDEMFGFGETLSALIGEVQSTIAYNQSMYTAQQQETAQWDTLRSQYYTGTNAQIAGEYFKGTQYEGMKFEDIASQYSSFAGDYNLRTAFEGALSAVLQSNSELKALGYIDDTMESTAASIQALVDNSFGTPTTTDAAGNTVVNVTKALSDLQARNRTDGGDTQYTRDLEDNEASYAKAQEVGDQAEMERLIQDRQAIYNTQALAIEGGIGSVEQMDRDIVVKQQEISDANDRQSQLTATQDQIEAAKVAYEAQGDAQQRTEYAESHAGQSQLTDINAQLGALGLDKIESLNQLGAALESINTAKGDGDSGLRTLNEELVNLQANKVDALVQIQNALDTVAWNAQRVKDANLPTALQLSDETSTRFSNLANKIGDCRSKAAELKTQLDSLKGDYEISVNLNYLFKKPPSFPTPAGTPIDKQAHGGIYDGAFLSWVAEDGPEAIIPLGAKRRDRGLDLWLEAGRQLGVTEDADSFGKSGILSPFAGNISSTPDSDYGHSDAPLSSANSGGTVVYIDVSSEPSYAISGSNTEDIVEQLSKREHDVVELLAEMLSERMEDIQTNPS